MCLKPGEDIGEEIHYLDQFLRIEQGSGKAVLDDFEHNIAAEWAVVVPAGTKHNIINTSNEETKIYTVYSPPNHKDGTIHLTKADAESNEEHFDFKISLKFQRHTQR